MTRLVLSVTNSSRPVEAEVGRVDIPFSVALAKEDTLLTPTSPVESKAVSQVDCLHTEGATLARSLAKVDAPARPRRRI